MSNGVFGSSYSALRIL